MGKKKSSDTIERIISLYVNEKLPMEAIAKKLCINKKTIKRYLLKNNINIRNQLYYIINSPTVYH